MKKFSKFVLILVTKILFFTICILWEEVCTFMMANPRFQYDESNSKEIEYKNVSKYKNLSIYVALISEIYDIFVNDKPRALQLNAV